MEASPGSGNVGRYEEALVRYGLDVCTIGCERGNADTCAATLVADLAGTTAIASVRTQEELQAAGEIPPWPGEPTFHRRNQAALVRQNPTHYRPYFSFFEVPARGAGGVSTR